MRRKIGFTNWKYVPNGGTTQNGTSSAINAANALAGRNFAPQYKTLIDFRGKS